MPNAQDVNDRVGQFVAQFVLAYEQSPDVARRKFFKGCTDPRMREKLLRAFNQLPRHLRCRAWIDRCEKSVQPNQISFSIRRPFQRHLLRSLVEARGPGSNGAMIDYAASIYVGQGL